MKLKALLTLGLLATLPLATHAQVRITEWMYNGANGTNEFVEISNLGGSSVSLTGWSFDDNSRTPGSFSLSGLGSLGSHQSAIITEDTAAHFRSIWNLSASVPVIGGNDQNLGRSDEINIYDASSLLVDRLSYNDQGTGVTNSVRTLDFSGNPNSLSVVGANTANAWSLSSVGDARGSYASSLGDIGNPGTFSLIPEPSTYALMGLGAVALLFRLRRK